MLVQAPAGPAFGSKQVPQPQCPSALQVEFGTVLQPVGHWPFVLKHASPEHSQQTGGATQPHFPVASFAHCDPGGAPAGQMPVQAFVAKSRWQMFGVVVVVVDVVVVVVTVVDVVVVVWPTTIFSTGAQSICGGPTGSGPSGPN